MSTLLLVAGYNGIGKEGRRKKHMLIAAVLL
jgi:hypothetical protein